MTAERRYCPRHPLSLHVQVLYGKRRFCSARVRGLSVQGMSLTLHNLTLPVGTLVELGVEGLGREWLLEAVVVHSEGTDVGVLFREPQPALHEGLLRIDVADPEDTRIGPIGAPVSRPERPQLLRH